MREFPPLEFVLWDRVPDAPRSSSAGPHCDAEDFAPCIQVYRCDSDEPRPLVLICPGGGYAGCTLIEREPVARWLNGLGMHAAVLYYRVKPWLYPAAMMDGRQALKVIADKSEAWGVDLARIGVLGFSAGGHVAGCLALVDDPIPGSASVPRPSSLLLAYPVVTMTGSAVHESSRGHLLGDEYSCDLCSRLSLENRVDNSAPPLFIWHGADDDVVSPLNSTQLISSYLSKGRPCDGHFFQSTGHGAGVGQSSHARCWTDLAAQWYGDLYGSSGLVHGAKDQMRILSNIKEM